MALSVPVGCARLRVSTPARVRPVIAASANVSPLKDDAVDWAAATSSFFEQDSRPIMLYDGVCNLCNGGVRFVRNNDKNRRIRFEALQSEAGKKLLRRSGRAPNDISSVVLVEKERQSNMNFARRKRCVLIKKERLHETSYDFMECVRSYIKSEAVLKIMEYIDLPFPHLAFFLQFVPLFIRDFAYDNVANNRYSFFGRSDSCEIIE